MSYRFSEDQRRIQELIRRVAAERVAPRGNGDRCEGGIPAGRVRSLGELGLFTLPFPSEYGGSGSLVSECLAIEFVTNRRAFGRSVGDFQGVRWMIADMAIQVEAARISSIAPPRRPMTGSPAKSSRPSRRLPNATPPIRQMRVATDAVQLFGAAGISNEMPINRYFRDAKVLQLVEGTNQIQRNIIARNLLGSAAPG